jgi:hypothetical protein
MTLHELETELKDKWDELLAHIHALFHKEAPAPVEAPQAVVDPVITPTVIIAPTVTPPVVANPTEASLGVGATDPNYIDPRFPNGVSGLTPDSFDPHKTNLDPSDFGKVFKAEPGTTTYTVNVPNGARAFLLRDGEFQADQMATFAIDGNPPEKCIFTGPIAQLSVGIHTVTVACNYEMSFQIQPVA